MANTPRNRDIFASKVRTLTVDELKHVGGATFEDNQEFGSKPSAIKIDAAGYFR